ncbi:hypothetical protein HK102_002664 [Quaeritorhiza haematococci]|nr:hypothetical protein HK102_002664 [Quaeritorhiza haematococci]
MTSHAQSLPSHLLDPSVTVSEFADHVGVRLSNPQSVRELHKNFKAIVGRIIDVWDQNVPHVRRLILTIIQELGLDATLRRKLVQEKQVSKMP